MPEDLSFISYLSRPTSVRERQRRLGRFRTLRWLLLHRADLLKAKLAMLLTAHGADNFRG